MVRKPELLILVCLGRGRLYVINTDVTDAGSWVPSQKQAPEFQPSLA